MPVPAAISDLSQTPGSNSPSGSESPTSADDYLRTLSAFIAQLRDGSGFATSAGVVPPGTVIDFAGPAAPAGYLACDGSAVSRTTYAALYSTIGTIWGVGNGTTTFNLPDMRRRTTIGSGGTAVSGPANTIGSVGGAETHTLNAGEMPSHNHGVSDPGHSHSITDPGHSHSYTASAQAANNAAGGIPDYIAVTAGTTSTATTGISVNAAGTGITTVAAGSGGAHNNMPPSAVVTKCIKF